MRAFCVATEFDMALSRLVRPWLWVAEHIEEGKEDSSSRHSLEVLHRQYEALEKSPTVGQQLGRGYAQKSQNFLLENIQRKSDIHCLQGSSIK